MLHLREAAKKSPDFKKALLAFAKPRPELTLRRFGKERDGEVEAGLEGHEALAKGSVVGTSAVESKK